MASWRVPEVQALTLLVMGCVDQSLALTRSLPMMRVMPFVSDDATASMSLLVGRFRDVVAAKFDRSWASSFHLSTDSHSKCRPRQVPRTSPRKPTGTCSADDLRATPTAEGGYSTSTSGSNSAGTSTNCPADVRTATPVASTNWPSDISNRSVAFKTSPFAIQFLEARNAVRHGMTHRNHHLRITLAKLVVWFRRGSGTAQGSARQDRGLIAGIQPGRSKRGER